MAANVSVGPMSSESPDNELKLRWARDRRGKEGSQARPMAQRGGCGVEVAARMRTP